MKRFVVLLLLLLAGVALAQQESTTLLKGRVVDAKTGEPLPFVSIHFEGTNISTTSDLDGKFSIQNTDGHTTVQFRMLGYQVLNRSVVKGRRETGAKIMLRPEARQLETVEVRPGKKSRYRRRGNPAVQLVENVISHREANYVEFGAPYSLTSYEKMTIALDDFHPDVEGSRVWRHFPFLPRYIDTLPDEQTVLGFSVRERVRKERHDAQQGLHDAVLVARRMLGVDHALENEGLGDELAAMFPPVAIFESDIDLMLNKFVSPLSPVLATTFYRYYLTDTLVEAGERLIELSFLPASKQSYGFTGQMYVRADSSYALVRYHLEISGDVNLNFVRGVAVDGYYRPVADGRLALDSTHTNAIFSIHPRLQEARVRQTIQYRDYGPSAPLPDPAGLKLRKSPAEWRELRPTQLTDKETLIDSLLPELTRLPAVRRVMRVGEVLVTGYIATRRPADSSRFDIGPVFNLLSYNSREGLRLRLGGMTTAALSKRHFASGYVAIGTRDPVPRFDVRYYYTLSPRRKHPRENPRRWFSVSARRDVQFIGQTFDILDPDNLLMSTRSNRPTRTLLQADAEFNYQFGANLNVSTQLMAQRYSKSELLPFVRSDGSLASQLQTLEWTFAVGYTPRRTSNRLGKASLLNLGQNPPSITLRQTFGLLDEGGRYSRSDLAADYRLWLSAFGHIDLSARAGIIWNPVPLHKLYSPNANPSLLLSEGSFGTLRPMQYVVDRYVQVHAAYYLKGLILGRLPLLNQLHLREVLSLGAYYGSLSDDNAAALAYAETLDRLPLVEAGVGVENIFRVLSIHYIRRLTYTDGQRSAIKLGLKVSL